MLNLDVSQARKRGHREGMVEGKNAEMGCDVGAVRGESQKGRKLKAEWVSFMEYFWGGATSCGVQDVAAGGDTCRCSQCSPSSQLRCPGHVCPPCRVLVLLPLYLTCKRTSLCLLEPLFRMLLGVYLPQGFL